jgi:endonuclease/exonuclease/phosphatase family metal-dependent hydrolase
MERRMKAIEVEGIRIHLRFNSVFTVSSNGRKGGLAMFWRDTIDLEIRNFSRNHIDAIIKDSTVGKMWRLTGFYGSPERSGRSETWQLLKRLGDQNQVPWVVLGDFNEILYNSEKMGKAARAKSQMKVFREVLDNHCLRDLGFRDPWYTWDNRRLGLENIKERLDRVVAGLDWSTLYPEAWVKHLSASASDHRPAQLLLNKQSVHHR